MRGGKGGCGGHCLFVVSVFGKEERKVRKKTKTKGEGGGVLLVGVGMRGLMDTGSWGVAVGGWDLSFSYVRIHPSIHLCIRYLGILSTHVCGHDVSKKLQMLEVLWFIGFPMSLRM